MNTMQLTVAIIKPPVVKVPPILSAVQNIILNNGFYFIRTRHHKMTKCEAENFYKEHENKFFYNRLVTFMSSGPSIVHILAREDAIKTWRQLMGPTKVFQSQHTHPESIRGMFGLTDTRNATHGSDSEESVKKEIKFFFPEFNYDEWFSKEACHFLNGNVTFEEKLVVHLPIVDR